MIDEKKFDIINIIILTILMIAAFFTIVPAQANIAVDTGREFYIPARMLSGEVLFKDIFNIYGPLAYFINSFAFMVFGTKINSLFLCGSINSLLILIITYFLSREFFNPVHSFILTGFTLASGVFASGLFNYTVPYSYAMSYGLYAFLMTLFFMIKFIKTDNKLFLYFCSFFAGCALCFKLDFIIAPILLLLSIVIFKNFSKLFLPTLMCFLIMPVISFSILALQGITFENLTDTLKILKTLSQTDAIKVLYTLYGGTFFNATVFSASLLKTLFFGILICCVYLFDVSQNNFGIKRLFLIIAGTICMVFIGNAAFSLFPIINFLLFVLFFKKIFNNKPLFILMCGAFLLSLKSFFTLNMQVYGTFILPLLVISVIAFIFEIIPEINLSEKVSKSLKNTAYTMVLIGIVLYTGVNGGKLSEKSAILKTDKGTIQNFPQTVQTYQKTYDFIMKNTKIDDIVVILPETPFLNFLTNRPGDNLYDSLTPLYFEAFGEQNVINHFKQTRPEYFVLNNRDTSDYGKQYLCTDYAVDFCNYIEAEYKNIENFGDTYMMRIFKRKDLQ